MNTEDFGEAAPQITAGISIAEALKNFREGVNRAGTMFSTDEWLNPKLQRLRALLSDPITADQAAALLDVLYSRHWMRDLIEWLETAPTVPWAEFFELRRKAEAERQAAQAEQDAFWTVDGDEFEDRVCPRCKSAEVIPILYGLPSEEGRAAARRGEIALGGCSLQLHGPQYVCGVCSLRWRWKSLLDFHLASPNSRRP